MDESELRSRLSQISTRWSLIRVAHGDETTEVQRAQAELFDRYRGAAYRYLVAALRSPDAADEVFQDFAVRLLKGDFHRAAPEHGRFRNYLKTALSRLIIDFRRRRGRADAQAINDLAGNLAADPDAEDAQFDECWRTEMLERAWNALAEGDRESGRPHYAVLRYRSEHPDAPSRDLADALNQQLNPARPYTEAGIRQIVHRAREQFADLLLEEVGTSLGTRDVDAIEAELAALKLLSYCRTALEARRR
jgi:RNA polymerase sigma-70 factor (ECF subfamily)